MKKLSVILAIVLCVSVLFCAPVNAASPEVDLYVTPIGTNLTVSIESSSALGGIQGVIGYDEDVVTYDSSAVNSAISSFNKTQDTFSHSDEAGSTSIALVGNPESGTSGVWATIGYIAPVSTPAEFSLANFITFNKNGVATKATFDVIVLGDANEDKIVDIKDYVRFMKILKNAASAPEVEKCLDVNRSGDGYGNSDLSQLRKNLLAG